MKVPRALGRLGNRGARLLAYRATGLVALAPLLLAGLVPVAGAAPDPGDSGSSGGSGSGSTSQADGPAPVQILDLTTSSGQATEIAQSGLDKARSGPGTGSGDASQTETEVSTPSSDGAGSGAGGGGGSVAGTSVRPALVTGVSRSVHQAVAQAVAQAAGRTGGDVASILPAATDPQADATLLTDPLEVDRFLVAGFTWTGSADLPEGVRIYLRVRENGTWSPWYLNDIETGGVRVTNEVVLENKIDLVIGYEEGVDRAALEKAGVQLYSPAAFCPDYSVQHATWDLIDTEVNNLAAIFGVQDRAAGVISERKAAVERLDASGRQDKGSGIALYITPGDPNFYAYGTSSMVQPIFEANGIKNSYDDTTTRVFDGSMEDILGKNPDWIVLLSLDTSDEETLEAFKGFQGAGQLKAVAEGKVVVLPFALTDPPTTLSVNGATKLSEKLASR